MNDPIMEPYETWSVPRIDGLRAKIRALKTRNKDILAMRCMGASVSEVAEEVGLSASTTHAITQRLFDALLADTEYRDINSPMTLICWNLGFEEALDAVNRHVARKKARDAQNRR